MVLASSGSYYLENGQGQSSFTSGDNGDLMFSEAPSGAGGDLLEVEQTFTTSAPTEQGFQRGIRSPIAPHAGCAAAVARIVLVCLETDKFHGIRGGRSTEHAGGGFEGSTLAKRKGITTGRRLRAKTPARGQMNDTKLRKSCTLISALLARTINPDARIVGIHRVQYLVE